MVSDVLEKMILYFDGDVRRINHALKVYGFAKTIAEREGLSFGESYVTELAAVLHDIGIKEAERKYGSSDARYQEAEGPSVAAAILEETGEKPETVERVCFLVGHHHTYGAIDRLDFQILVEADFLVNIFEDEMESHKIKAIREKYFRTGIGTEILDSLYQQAISP